METNGMISELIVYNYCTEEIRYDKAVEYINVFTTIVFLK